MSEWISNTALLKASGLPPPENGTGGDPPTRVPRKAFSNIAFAASNTDWVDTWKIRSIKRGRLRAYPVA